MLWDSGSVKKEGDEEQGEVPITPILVPLQNKGPPAGKSVPLLVPDVQDLKDQFQQQQNMLTQIKETLKHNESQLSSKGKQVEVYANKLSQIRARSKTSQGKKLNVAPSQSLSSQNLTKKSSKENLTKSIETSEEKGSNSKVGRKGKVSELKKCLEENKLKFEQRAGKEQSETKKIETLVEQLKTQLEERDKIIQDLQKNIEQPVIKPESAQKKLKTKSDKESVASKTTQTLQPQPHEESIEIIGLQNKIYELETTILDLRENLKEKESVIDARTQAVTLLSQDLSLKGKNTLESLEETRQEMRAMQNNFIAMEDELRKNLLDRENRLKVLDEKCKKLESINFELSLKNAEQQEKVVNLQEKYRELEKESKSLPSGKMEEQTDDKLEELTKKISSLTKELDDRNKSMIKMKIEHKNKLKSLNKTLETLKSTSDDKAEIARLSNLVEELLNVKTGLENRVAELEDEKVTEKKLKDQINELEIMIKKQNEDITLHLQSIESLQKENSRLAETNEQQTVLIENLRSNVQKNEGNWLKEESEGGDIKLKELSRQFENLEEEHKKKIEDLKLEHSKEIQMIESYYNSKVENLDRKELEEFRISTEINNIHVEEQIELLIREKQQLLEKLKSLSGVSSTDSLTFEKMEHSDLREDKEVNDELDSNAQNENNRSAHLQRIVKDQQLLITDLQKDLNDEKEKVAAFEKNVKDLEETIKNLESLNTSFKQQLEVYEAGESGKTQKSNVNNKNKMKKVEMELSQAKKTVQEQQDKLLELSQKLEEKEGLIKNYTERIELFEKDDWDRQNHWKTPEDDFETLQELQKKCLSLENSLIELGEDCERLRKENIEVVHLLSEEKVKRRKLLEQMEAGVGAGVEEKIYLLNDSLKILEEKINNLEARHSEFSSLNGNETSDAQDIQGKLEWANVVITGKDTEIFRLQSLLEDRNKAIEIMESDLSEQKLKLEEKERKLNETMESLKLKEVQLEEISANFDKLQECVDVANQKTSTNETQLKELLTTVKEMEGDVFRKESELQEIKGILAEKNLDMTNLRNRLEEVNSDLTYSYQEHLENMGKCLRDKEAECEALVSEKASLEEANRILLSEKEVIYNQKMEISNELEKLKQDLNENKKTIEELTQKLDAASKSGAEKSKPQEMEELKIKMKKLAANLKKKAQNEIDLQNQVKELKESISEKEKEIEKLRGEVTGVTEKWTVEKSEKEVIRNDLSQVLLAKAALEDEKAELKERLGVLTKELENLRFSHESQAQEMKKEIQILNKSSGEKQMLEEQYKGKVVELEKKLSETCQMLEKADITLKGLDEEKQNLLRSLAEITGKYEETKFKHDQVVLEKVELEKRLEEVSKFSSEYSCLDAKIQENMAVIESLESELDKTRNHLKTVEEKFFFSEERRMSLESKNDELCKKIMEDSQTLVTIDDLSIRIEELLKSEKLAQDYAKNLEAGNAELKVALDQIQSEKFNLESEIKSCGEKMSLMSREIEQLRQNEADKNGSIQDLTKELEKSKAEYKQISEEFKKLNKDYEQFESDFKENLESSQSVEKSLKQRVEELTNENAMLMEKCNLLSEDKNTSRESEEADKKPKKRKSVTFRTDEVEYIKELKNQLHSYDDRLKEANAEIETLKADLFREKLRQEVLNVVSEAQEKVESLRSTPEKKERLELEPEIVKKLVMDVERSPEERKFDANVFFGSNDNSSFFDKPKVDEPESLAWDDDWGADGHLEQEYFSEKMETPNEKVDNNKLKALESEISKLREENDKLMKESQEQMTKYTKALKKLKELKVGNEKLREELKKVKNGGGFGDLDAAIVDELKCQIESMETKEKELVKSLEAAKQEKESLLKKIEVLNEGNEKFLEMKERQNNDVEVWQKKNNELLKEISELRQQLKDPQVVDDNVLVQENRELRNTIEALEWKNCELNELLEEKQEQLEIRSEAVPTDVEKVIEEKSLLQKEIDELNNVKATLERKLFDEEKKSSATIGELSEQITALASENETLQDILGKIKTSNEPQKTKLFDYFNSTSSPQDDFFAAAAAPQTKVTDSSKAKDNESANATRAKETEINELKLKVSELESLLKVREEELSVQQQARNEVDSLRVKLTEIEQGIKLRDDELHHLRNFNLEKENEVVGLRQSIFELENLITLKDEELKRIREELSSVQQTKNVNEFETVDLNRPQSVFQPDDADALQKRIFDLEGLLSVREGEIEMAHQSKEKETESLRQQIFELENLIRVKEEEMHRLAVQWNDGKAMETEQLHKKIGEMEEFIRFKENEAYEIQAIKENEIRNLQQQIFELRQSGDQSVELQQQISDLRFQEQEFHRLLCEKSNEIDCLQQKLENLESIVSKKDEELRDTMTKLNELEKSYNDSKLEIERLLNEEKLNSEEKFVEPFQKNIQIPVQFELEAMSRTLNEEKQKSENLKYELSEKDNILQGKNEEILFLNAKIQDMDQKAKEREEENPEGFKLQLEKIISELQQELETSNLQLEVTKRELEEFQKVKEEAVAGLKTQLSELESELGRTKEKYLLELSELREKESEYKILLEAKEKEEVMKAEELEALKKMKSSLEKDIEIFKSELESKENDITAIGEMLEEERSKVLQLSQLLETRESEVMDLRQTLSHLQSEITQFRNFENQVRELRVAQIQESGAELTVTPEGQPDLSDWTEHELAELSTRLQSDLDTALYMLHQRDVRCDELTFELMQLLEERDTLQLRLSTALRINEELRATGKAENLNKGESLQENKDLEDQSNDRQREKRREPSEDLRQLANKISELHSVSYLRDKTVKDESVQRHKEQMNLLSRVSDTDISLGRDVQGSSGVLLNWVRGKSTPKVMHI